VQCRGKPSGIENRNTIDASILARVCGLPLLRYLSSLATSLESRRFLSTEGRGGGDEDGPGDIDFCRDDLRDPRDGVLYGVSVGVGSEA
jgi:hypothetical protein